MNFDVFNGDADGLCALQQLRLSDPRASHLVTGVKRDIALLDRVEAAAGDEVVALDISFDVNRRAALGLAERGVNLRYFDHHYAGAVPPHPRLWTMIDTGSEVCTALLVDRYLAGAHRGWAIVAAFGDGLGDVASALATASGFDAGETTLLRQLGECLNYNAYGEDVSDLWFHPAALFRLLQAHVSPLSFARDEPGFHRLQEGYTDDMMRARESRPVLESLTSALFVLPDAPWSRRVNGVFGNYLAAQDPERAYAVLVRNARGGYLVSVRAPLTSRTGADELCRRFPSGGGRKAAAGINHLAADMFEKFSHQFQAFFTTGMPR